MGLTEAAIVIQAEATEQQLIDRARAALDNSHWVVGQCASEWTQRYAKGRTDADFGKLVGLEQEQVNRQRRVWETFGDVYASMHNLSWTHFLVALGWDDAAECLQWASDEGWSVREMQAWRKAQHENGNHISQEQEPEELADDPCNTNPVVDHKQDYASEDPVFDSDEPDDEDTEQEWLTEPDLIERETPVTRKPEVTQAANPDKLIEAIRDAAALLIEANLPEDRTRVARELRVIADQLEAQS